MQLAPSGGETFGANAEYAHSAIGGGVKVMRNWSKVRNRTELEPGLFPNAAMNPTQARFTEHSKVMID